MGTVTPSHVELDDGRIVATGTLDDVVAVRWGGHPMPEAGWPIDDASMPGRSAPRLLAWSGSLGDGLFEPHPHTWMPVGHETLAALCDAAAPRLEAAGRRLCLQPHCLHVLSDAPSCARFLDDRAGQPFEIAIAPTMLSPAMLEDAAEHLERILERLGDRCALVVLPRDDTIPPDVLSALLARHVPPHIPLIADS